MGRLLSIFLLLCSCLPVLGQSRVITTTAQRPTTEAPAISLFQANPVTFRVKLDSTRPTLTGKTALTAEIRASKLDEDAPLAATTIDDPTGAGPFDLAFTSAQMNQDLDGAASADFWLVIYTTATGDVLDVLYTAPLKIKEHGASLTAPVPPNPAVALTQDDADELYAALSTVEAQAEAIAALLERIEALEAGSSEFVFLRPDGTSGFRRPDGTSLFARP